MFQVESYMETMVQGLRERFAHRLRYVGLQGSYLRGEATENSDLDVMVVLDTLSAADLQGYRELVERLPQPEKACGFICGVEELAAWSPLEICGLLHGTRDVYGQLAPLVPEFTRQDVVNFVKLGAGNLYHELCHRTVHGDPEENRKCLPGTYKGTFFLMQGIYYLLDGVYYPTKDALRPALRPKDREVMEMSDRMSRGLSYDFDQAFSLLLAWCKGVLVETV